MLFRSRNKLTFLESSLPDSPPEKPKFKPIHLSGSINTPEIKQEFPIQEVENDQIKNPEVNSTESQERTISENIIPQIDGVEPDAEEENKNHDDVPDKDAVLDHPGILNNKQTEEITEEENPSETIPLNAAICDSSKDSSKIDQYEEDNNILKLLERDEPELAYHLAKCYESEKKKLLVSSSLLANLFLSLKIRTATGPIASMIEANIENYDMTFSTTDKGYLKNHLIFASILRPGIFAFNSSGAGIVLEDIHPGKMTELFELKNLILGFMSQFDGALNFEVLLASTLAAHAQSLANGDVQTAQRVYTRRGGSDMGAMLGGIIIGDLLSGGMRGGFGGWSPTSFGGSPSSSDGGFMGGGGRF